MLHIRVVSPPAATGRLTERLRAADGVVNLVVLPAAAPARTGAAGLDAVQFDVTGEAANEVLRYLRELGLDRDGSIVVETVDAVIGPPPRRARRPAWRPSHQGEHVPVWDLVEARIADDARYAPSFFVLLVFAGLHRRLRHPDELADPHRRRHDRGARVQRHHLGRTRH